MNLQKLFRAKTILSLSLLAVICGCQKQESNPGQSTSAQKAAIVSAEKTSFDDVTAKLDKGGGFYLYMSTEQVLGGLDEKLATVSNVVAGLPGVAGEHGDVLSKVFVFLTDLAHGSGIEEISGVGMSSIAREPGFYYNKMVVHHYPGKDHGVIWSVAGKAAHPLSDLDMLPDTTALAMFGDLDMPLLWTNIEAALLELKIPQVDETLQNWPGQFHTLTQLDFNATLASLGGDYGLVMTLDDQKTVSIPMPGGTVAIPSPALAIVWKVKSDLIFNRVDTLLKGNSMVTSVDTNGLKMRTMMLPISFGVELRPTIAQAGDLLILSTTDTLVKDMLDVKASKKKSIKTTAEFARLSQGIPAEGNHFWFASDKFTKTIMQIQQQSLGVNGTLTQEQVKSLQSAFTQGTNFGAYAVGANGSDGWVSYANGSQGFQTAILPLAVAGAGMAAAIAVPNFVRARATSQVNSCVNNLRLIDSAKQQWALEHNKGAQDTPTMADLKPYLGKIPTCPVGGQYTIGAVGEKPTCSVAEHVLP